LKMKEQHSKIRPLLSRKKDGGKKTNKIKNRGEFIKIFAAF